MWDLKKTEITWRPRSPNSGPTPLSALPWLPYKLRPTSLSPLMRHSLKLWDSVRYSGNLMSPFPPLLPLLNIPWFPTGLDQPDSFSWWSTHGFTEFWHFLSSHTFPSWSSFQNTQVAPPAEFCRYAQMALLTESQLLLPFSKYIIWTTMPPLNWSPMSRRGLPCLKVTLDLQI